MEEKLRGISMNNTKVSKFIILLTAFYQRLVGLTTVLLPKRTGGYFSEFVPVGHAAILLPIVKGTLALHVQSTCFKGGINYM